MTIPDSAQYWWDVEQARYDRRMRAIDHPAKTHFAQQHGGRIPLCGSTVDLVRKPWRGTRAWRQVTCKACLQERERQSDRFFRVEQDDGELSRDS